MVRSIHRDLPDRMGYNVMSSWKEHPVTGVPKPRQTRSDKWQQRPAVVRYRAYADELRLRKVDLPESGAHVVFILPMPASWKPLKRAMMNGRPHQQKPDSDNLLKALLDAVKKDDSGIWDVRVSKYWGETGKIYISEDVAPTHQTGNTPWASA